MLEHLAVEPSECRAFWLAAQTWLVDSWLLTLATQVVHDYWFQISGSIGSVEALYEDDEFAHRELAALLASKVGHGRGVMATGNGQCLCRVGVRHRSSCNGAGSVRHTAQVWVSL